MLAVLMLAGIAFSVFFVVFESDHECAHGNCCICRQISICVNLFRRFSSGPDTPGLTAALISAVVLLTCAAVCLSLSKTLIDLKIKLSD
ncbi:MAG: hypothetical protein K6F64_02845 [Clostridia bacterium]|nr:hypothetical protein [Clostridia bacterium]